MVVAFTILSMVLLGAVIYCLTECIERCGN